MKSLALGIVAAAFAGGAAMAQTTTGSPPSSAPMNNAPRNSAGVTAASGNNNQAVATTGANAATPAHGANSFTDGQAKHRLEEKGFSNVADLAKDQDGVWRGTAQHDGQPVKVWVDYKGSVGQQQ